MNFVTQNAKVEAELAGDCCRRRAEWMWATDDIILAGADQRAIANDAIDALPPWRAMLYVRVAVEAGAQLPAGITLETLNDAVKTAGGHAKPGWWTAALGVDPAPPRTPPAPTGEYVPPTGWKVVGPPNTGAF